MRMRKMFFPLLIHVFCCCNSYCLSNRNIVELLQREPDEVIDVLKCDKPWELKFDYATILKTDTCYVMYYRARNSKQYPRLNYCRAISKDGIHWEKPNLYQIEYDGSTENNIVSGAIDGVCVEYANGIYWLLSDRTYVDGVQKRGLVLYRSSDGIHFERYSRFEVPYFCDSQNRLLWDSTTNTFKLYLRSWYKSPNRNRVYHHTHGFYRAVSLFETPTLDCSLPLSATPLYLTGKKEPPAVNKELPIVIENRSKTEDFDIYGAYVNKYREDLYIAYPINYYHTDDMKRGGKLDNDGYATIGFWVSNDGRKFDEVKRDYITDGYNWMEFCIGHIETDEMFVHYYINFNGTHAKQTPHNLIKARIHYKNAKKLKDEK
jgi:hypothetical protein